MCAFWGVQYTNLKHGSFLKNGSLGPAVSMQFISKQLYSGYGTCITLMRLVDGGLQSVKCAFQLLNVNYML